MQDKGAYHWHKGQEYYSERRMKWTKQPNPFGYRCHWCGKVIKWAYKDGILWDRPTYYCRNHNCQRVRQHRADIAEQEQRA